MCPYSRTFPSENLGILTREVPESIASLRFSPSLGLATSFACPGSSAAPWGESGVASWGSNVGWSCTPVGVRGLTVGRKRPRPREALLPVPPRPRPYNERSDHQGSSGTVNVPKGMSIVTKTRGDFSWTNIAEPCPCVPRSLSSSYRTVTKRIVPVRERRRRQDEKIRPQPCY